MNKHLKGFKDATCCLSLDYNIYNMNNALYLHYFDRQISLITCTFKHNIASVYISYQYCHSYLKQKEEEVQHKRDNITKDEHLGIRQEIKGDRNLKAKIPSVLGKTAFSFVSMR